MKYPPVKKRGSARKQCNQAQEYIIPVLWNSQKIESNKLLLERGSEVPYKRPDFTNLTNHKNITKVIITTGNKSPNQNG